MELSYKEILKLKGRELIDNRSNTKHIVTSSTKTNVILDNGIKIKTVIFYEHTQQFYTLQ
jgi:hypothetical protein